MSKLPQQTMGEILETERQMVLNAPDRFGLFYVNAFNVGVLLQHGIVGVTASRDIFAMFASQVKKHHLLALFSFARLHQIQGLMNLRQTIESGASAAYAIAHNDPVDFVTADSDGILDPALDLTRRRYRWLDENYREGSTALKELKDSINRFGAHSNIIQTANNFAVEERWFSTPFFDAEDDYFVKTDLYRSSAIGLTLLDLFVGINRAEQVLKFTDDFFERFDGLAVEHNNLRDEMRATERYQRVQGIASSSRSGSEL